MYEFTYLHKQEPGCLECKHETNISNRVFVRQFEYVCMCYSNVIFAYNRPLRHCMFVIGTAIGLLAMRRIKLRQSRRFIHSNSQTL